MRGPRPGRNAMSFFDDALKDAVPGGNLATPIAIAAGALLLHHFLGGKARARRRASARPRARLRRRRRRRLSRRRRTARRP